MAEQYIFTMQNLRKVVPPQREILRGIYLSFFPGAKIGILGLNGAGKSTVLRIMAGLDKEFTGEAFPAEGTRIGYLSQDPQLDPKKTVLENVEDGVAPVKKLLARFDELGEKMGEALPDAEMEKVMAEYGRVQDAIEAANGWDLDRTLETAMDALRCPPPDADVAKISGGERRRVALCRLLLEKNDMLLLDEPTNHLDAESVAWLEQFLKEFPGHRRRGHARPLLPRQRRRLDPRARPRRGHPVEGQLLLVARAEGSPARDRGEDRERAPEVAQARARVGAHGAARAAGEEQGAPAGVRAARLGERRRGARRDERDLHSRRARASATSS